MIAMNGHFRVESGHFGTIKRGSRSKVQTSIEPENSMRIQGLYAALTTKNISEAERFYTTLFGRAPNDRPLQGLIQWHDIASANLQIFQDKKRAGGGRCTIVIPQMSVARQTLANAGLSLRDEREGDFGKIAQLHDPDGNLITLAEPPAIQTR